MQVVLQAVSGPVAGRRIEVRTGSALRIGRTTKADYAVGEDSYLSGQHFLVECDGAQCCVRDLGSSNGTFLNGERLTETAVVKEGDTLAAGGSTFTVHIEEAPAAPAPENPRLDTVRTLKYVGLPAGANRAAPSRAGERAAAGWPGYSRPQTALLNRLYRDEEQVFAVLDPVKDSRIPAFLDASGAKFTRLDDTLRYSPFLVLLPRESQLLDVLVKDGWNHGWGFYCVTPMGLEAARFHWRGFVVLRNERGREVTFRFWDPRVLRAIVPAMTAEEAAEFFGSHTRLIVEGERPEMAVEFSLASRGVREEAVMLL